MFNDYHVTMDSFGQECPENWEQIAAYLNKKIDALPEYDDDRDTKDAVESIWNKYWNAYHSGELPDDAPIPVQIWYAVMTGPDDDDWGTGSYNRDEALKMVRANLDIYPDGYIAVIDIGNSDSVCIDEIHDI